MQRIELEAVKREEFGKEKVKKARARGLIPGIVYGKEVKNVPIYVEKSALLKLLKEEAKESMIIKLKVNRKNYNVVLRDIQYHPVTYDVLHVDFHAIQMDKPIEVTVKVHLIGEPEGVKKGGVLEFETRELDIRCLPTDIPDAIEVDVSGLDLNQFIKVKDITPPKGVEILEDPETVIAAVVYEEVEEEEAEEAAAITEEETPEPEVIKKGKEEKEEGEEEEE